MRKNELIMNKRVSISSKAQFALDVLAGSERATVERTISALVNRTNPLTLRRLRPSKYFTLRAGPTYRVVVGNYGGHLKIEDVVNRDRLTHFSVDKRLRGEISKEWKP
jgi:hypothetical protein